MGTSLLVPQHANLRYLHVGASATLMELRPADCVVLGLHLSSAALIYDTHFASPFSFTTKMSIPILESWGNPYVSLCTARLRIPEGLQRSPCMFEGGFRFKLAGSRKDPEHTYVGRVANRRLSVDNSVQTPVCSGIFLCIRGMLFADELRLYSFKQCPLHIQVLGPAYSVVKTQPTADVRTAGAGHRSLWRLQSSAAVCTYSLMGDNLSAIGTRRYESLLSSSPDDNRIIGGFG